MCGIFGFSGAYSTDPTKIRWLAIENESRGRHSTGLYTEKADKQQTKTLVKDILTASEYVETHDFKSAVSGARIVNGHTRAATVGAVTKENAHPFEFNYGTHVIGAHNGWVFDAGNYKDQHLKFGFDKAFEVDSQLIFAVLSKYDGDFNKLAEIQGAIACAFVMPEKHPGILFIYKQSGRELNVGMTKEGIYYSSEARPLRLIGCHGVMAVPDASIMMLKDGLVLDIMTVTPPVVTIPVGTQRTTYEDRLTASELAKLGITKTTPSYSPVNTGHTRGGKAKVTSMPSISSNDYVENQFTDQLTSLIEDVKSHIHDLVPNPINYLKSNSYSLPTGDVDVCLVLIKLQSSTPAHPPLRGWTVFDKEDSTIAGITALNGITVLRYPVQKCNVARKILFNDPMEEKPVWEFEFTPEARRVMEVTLNVPFPQGVQSTPAHNTGGISGEGASPFLWLGQALVRVRTKGLKRVGSILSSSGEDSSGVSKPVEQICTRHEGEQVSGDTTGSGTSRKNSDGVAGIYKGAYPTSNPGGGDGRTDNENQGTARIHGGGGVESNNGDHGDVSTTTPVIPKLTGTSVRSVLRTEKDTFHYKRDVSKVVNGQEYARTYNLWAPYMENLLNVKKLLSDAAILKLHDLNVLRQCYSLSYYASRIIELLSIDEYQLRTLDDAATKHVYLAIHEIKRGTPMKEGDSKKKMSFIL